MPNFPAPQLDADSSSYVKCQVAETLPIAAGLFFDWYLKQAPENFMQGTMVIAPVVAHEPLTRQPFGEKNASRMMHFEDGTVARERVLEENLPRSLTSQLFGYDHSIRLVADHATSTISVKEVDAEHCRVVWDYAFHARNAASMSVLKLFVPFDWKRNISNALNAMRDQLEAKHDDGSKTVVEQLDKAA